MSKPSANLGAALHRKKNEPAKAGGVASTFRSGDEDEPMKKTTYRLPVNLHRALQLHAFESETSMGDLVIKYIEEGLQRDQDAN